MNIRKKDQITLVLFKKIFGLSSCNIYEYTKEDCLIWAVLLSPSWCAMSIWVIRVIVVNVGSYCFPGLSKFNWTHLAVELHGVNVVGWREKGNRIRTIVSLNFSILSFFLTWLTFFSLYSWVFDVLKWDGHNLLNSFCSITDAWQILKHRPENCFFSSLHSIKEWHSHMVCYLLWIS